MELTDRTGNFIALQYTDACGHTRIQLLGNAAAVALLGHLKVQQLALTALTHGQRQDNGDDGMGMIALCVLDFQLRTGKQRWKVRIRSRWEM